MNENKEKLTYFQMAEEIIRKYNPVADKFGSIFICDEINSHFKELTKQQVLKLALDVDNEYWSSSKRRDEVLKFLQTKALDSDLHLKWGDIGDFKIAVQNGIIDLQTNELIEHTRENYLDSIIHVKWVKGARNPIWEKFLEETFEDDPTKIQTLQEYFGYSLMPCAKAKKALLAIGDPDTGKSVVGHIISNLHGDANVCSIPIKQMKDPRALCELVGKSLNMVPEIEVGEVIPDAIFKTLIGTKEPVIIRKMYVGYSTYKPYAKHIFFSNNMPVIKDASKGTINRILPLEFVNVITPSKVDIELPAKILADKEGLLNWSIEGALRLMENNFQFTLPESSIEILENYKKNNQTFAWFIDTYFIKDSNSQINYDQAWSLLIEAKSRVGISSELHTIMTKKKFTQTLNKLGINQCRIPDPNELGAKQTVILGLKNKPKN